MHVAVLCIICVLFSPLSIQYDVEFVSGFLIPYIHAKKRRKMLRNERKEGALTNKK